MTNKKNKFSVTRLFIYILLIITAITSLYPIIWIIMSSFNPGNSLRSSSLFPDTLTLIHYKELFVKRDFGLWYMNTLKIAFWNMILSVILVLTTAYVLSRFRFPGRRFGLMGMLIMSMFPSIMSLVAIYILLLQLNLLDNPWGLILVYAGGSMPLGAWLVKGYFDGIPRSIEEAAKIDGAGNLTIFFKVMMPLSVPILMFIALINFIGPWMDFILARLVLRSADNKTLAIGLFEMVTGRQNTEFTMFAAGAVLVALPITILYVALQRFLIEGITAGASKG